MIGNGRRVDAAERSSTMPSFWRRIELMKNQSGRKALVVFSDGVDRGSKDTMNDAVDSADRANVVVYTIYFKGEEERSNSGLSGRWPARWNGLSGRWRVPGWWRLSRRWPASRRRGRNRPSTEKRSWRRLPSAPVVTAYEAKKKDDLGPIYNQIARGTPQPVPADLYARHGR